MFKLKKNATFLHDVPVQWPVDGGTEEVILKTRFRVLDATTISMHNISTDEGQIAFLRAAVAGFPAVVDDEGQPIPDDDTLFDQVVGLTFCRTGLVNSFQAAMIGARSKN